MNRKGKEMKVKLGLVLLLGGILAVMQGLAQEIPLVYEVENTGANCAMPLLPDFEDLPVVHPLTDPFEWSDGSGRDTTFASWSCRRNEIMAEVEQYEIGFKPTRPDTITASYANHTLTVNVTVNGKTLTLNSNVTLPDGDGPFPAIIGMSFFQGTDGTGSLPSEIFTSRKIAGVEFVHDQVSKYNSPSLADPFYILYPELFGQSGQYDPWSWGVSRVIDGLELVADELPIDLKHLGVTGCSYAGKMALFAGAFDERIALTIAQESGGGGAAAWRVSETLGEVEKLGSTSNVWFRKDMFRFSGENVSKLPHDHHELMAMVAPRALLVLGNPDYVWLADESGYVSCRAAHEVWKNFGIGDRFGFSIVGGHGHCNLPAVQFPEVEAFVDKFMMDDSTVNTSNITINPYADVNYERWIEWWGNGESYFPEQFVGRTLTFEAECSVVGSDWKKAADEERSNGAYVYTEANDRNTKKDEIDAASLLEIPFSVDTSGNFTVFALMNSPTSDDDSYWIKMDNGEYTAKLSLGTNGWEWKKLGQFQLKEGDHTLYITYREEGGFVDKVCLSSYMFYEPEGLGDPAENSCDPKVGIESFGAQHGFHLGQNFPNPFNDKTTISFSIPARSRVSLKVFDNKGCELIELAGKIYAPGKHTLEFDAQHLSKGVYFYTLSTDHYSSTRKMVLSHN